MDWFINPYNQSGGTLPTLRECFTKNGVLAQFFEALITGLDLPWDSEDAPALDIDYFYNRSGSKIPAPIVMKFLDDSGEITDAGAECIVQLCKAKFKPKWTRLWNLTFGEEYAYNPIHNYDMSETTIRDLDTTHDKDSTTTIGLDSTNTETLNLNDKTTHGRTDEVDVSRYGFNSSDAVPTDITNETEGGTTELDKTGTDTTVIDSDRSDVVDEYIAGTEDETITRTRAGNIGVTTTQKMVEEERKVWMWNYFESVYTDLDSILALKVFDYCQV